MNYKILSANTIQELQVLVQEHIDEGWKPLGGMVPAGAYFQTMTFKIK